MNGAFQIITHGYSFTMSLLIAFAGWGAFEAQASIPCKSELAALNKAFGFSSLNVDQPQSKQGGVSVFHFDGHYTPEFKHKVLHGKWLSSEDLKKFYLGTGKAIVNMAPKVKVVEFEKGKKIEMQFQSIDVKLPQVEKSLFGSDSDSKQVAINQFFRAIFVLEGTQSCKLDHFFVRTFAESSEKKITAEQCRQIAEQSSELSKKPGMNIDARMTDFVRKVMSDHSQKMDSHLVQLIRERCEKNSVRNILSVIPVQKPAVPAAPQSTGGANRGF